MNTGPAETDPVAAAATGGDERAVAATASSAETRPLAPDPPQDASRPDQVFELRARAPVRALAISSGAAVAGAVVIVVSGHPAVTVLGSILLLFGLLLAIAAFVLTARLRSTVTLTSSELTVAHGRQRSSLAWENIERVEERGNQLVAVGGKGDLTVTVPPRPGTTYVLLLAALRLRLDASRGYATGSELS